MLPPNNVPETSVAGRQKLLPDPASNFGLFQHPGALFKEVEHHLGVRDYSDVYGFGGSSLGSGVYTNVRREKSNVIKTKRNHHWLL
jgi:hypothetical protein